MAEGERNITTITITTTATTTLLPPPPLLLLLLLLLPPPLLLLSLSFLNLYFYIGLQIKNGLITILSKVVSSVK
jgi:hypothetical protein